MRALQAEVTAPPMPLSERVSVRVGTSLITNGLRMVFSFAGGMVIARGLGARGYGEYQFLLASVASLSQFIDLGTSQAFFTFMARQRRHARFLLLYAGWLALQFALVVTAVGLLAPSRVIAAVWVGEQRGIILLAFAATFVMNEVWEAVNQLAEARRRTVVTQMAVTIQAAAHMTLVAVAVAIGRLTVPLVFVFILLEFAALVCVLGPRLVRLNVADDAPEPETASVVAEFWQYCRPLVGLLAVGFVCMFADRWMLQRFGGAAQQGYFALGQQLSTISLVAATSVLQVFWTEVASATAAGDRERTVVLFRVASRALYFVAAWMSCLFIPYTAEILGVTVGQEYAPAAASFALMLLYPLHQSLGRISGAFLQSAGETALYSRVSIIALVLSLPLGYFILAPRTAVVPGFALGAFGLTLKTVIAGVVSVNMAAFAIARRLHTRFDWAHQVATPAILLSLAFGSRLTVGRLAAQTMSASPTAAALVGAAAYALASAWLVYKRPDVLGLTRAQVASLVGIYRGLLPS